MTTDPVAPGLMSRKDRERWIAAYIAAETSPVDICNSDFVDDYIEATGAPFGDVWYGARKCPMLGRDLARMAKQRLLSRERTGIQGMAGMGFPKWVWSYGNPKRW